MNRLRFWLFSFPVRSGKGLDHRTENYHAVCRSQQRLHSTLWMRHQAEDVTFAIADSRDRLQRPVRISFAVDCFRGISVFRNLCRRRRRDVAENYLVVAFEFGERGRLAEIVTVHVRDRNGQHLTRLGGAGKRGVGVFEANVHAAAQKSQALIAHHCAIEQAGFEQNLKSVADAQYQAARAGEAVDRFHYRKEPRDGPGAQEISKRKSPGKNDCVAAAEVFGLMPDEFGGLADDRADRLQRVIVAVGTGKLDHSKFHWWASPSNLSHKQILQLRRSRALYWHFSTS